MPCGWHAYSQVLLSYEPEFACAEAKQYLNYDSSNFTEYYEVAVPNGTVYNQTQKVAQCTTFDFQGQNFSSYEEAERFSTGLELKKTTTMKCESGEFIFDDSKFSRTAVTEWSTVCDKKGWITFDTQSFMIGKLLGAFVFGAMSDAIGRFKTYFISLASQLLVGIVIAVSPHVAIYAVARLLLGATCSGVFLCSYILAVEFIGPENRTTPGLCFHMFYAVGYSLLAPIGYFVQDFRIISWVLAIPSILFMPYYFFMDESVQWLLGKKRLSDAEKIVIKAADYNKKTLQTPIFNNNENEETEEKQKGRCEQFGAMFVEIGKVFVGPYPKLRLRFLILFCLWFINSGSYYGLTLNTKNLGGDFIFNVLISGLVELPAISLMVALIAYWDIGRKKILASSYFFCGILNLIVAGLQFADGSAWQTFIIVLSMGGKFAISGAYAVIYLFSIEQFPTVIKNSGLGICSIMARIGGLLCPYVVVNAGDFWEPLPCLIFGAVAILAASLMIFLPETHKKVLPTTLEEGEVFGLEEKEDAVEKEKFVEPVI